MAMIRRCDCGSKSRKPTLNHQFLYLQLRRGLHDVGLKSASYMIFEVDEECCFVLGLIWFHSGLT